MNNQEQLLALKETTNRLKNQIKTYEEQEEELETKLDSIKNEKSSLNNLLYKIFDIYSNLKLKTLLEKENLNLYRYELSTNYAGTDTIGYVLIKKGIDPEIKYADVLKSLAVDNLHSYGYMTESEFYRLAEELDIDLDDEEAVENSDLEYVTDYYYSIELVTDYSDLDIDIEKIERWN